MAGNFLHEPLGQMAAETASKRRRGWVWQAGVIVVSLAAFGSVAWWMPRPAPSPSTGAVAVIAPAKPAPPPPAAIAPVPAPASADPAGTDDVRVVRPLGSAFPMGKFIPVPQDPAPPCPTNDARAQAASLPCPATSATRDRPKPPRAP